MNTCADLEAQAVSLLNQVASGPSRLDQIKAQMRELIRNAYWKLPTKEETKSAIVAAVFTPLPRPGVINSNSPDINKDSRVL